MPQPVLAEAQKGLLLVAERMNITGEHQQQRHQSGSVDDIRTEQLACDRLAWDEGNLTLHELQREQQDPRMKIDEPKTPFVRGASLGPMDDDTSTFLCRDTGQGEMN